VAERKRKDFKAVAAVFMLHFLGLIVGHAYLQNRDHQLLNPANARFGLYMTLGLALLVWVRGGKVLDGLVGSYVVARARFAEKATRVLLGFFTVEFAVNTIFLIVPFYNNFAAFGYLLTAAATYFLFRYMAGEKVNWKKWVRVWMVNIGVALAIILFSSTAHTADKKADVNKAVIVQPTARIIEQIPSAENFLKGIDFDDPVTWLVIAVVLLALGFSLNLKHGNTSANTQPASEPNHGGGHA